MRSDGSLFKPKGSQNWHCCVYLRGKKYRMTTGTPDKKQALKFLVRKRREIGADIIGAKKFTTPQAHRMTNHDVLENLKATYELEDKWTRQTKSHWTRADKDFGQYVALETPPSFFNEYRKNRRAQGDSKAAINRPLQILRAAFAQAVEIDEILPYAPHIALFSEKGNARKGFCTETEFRRIKDALPDHLQDFAHFAYCTGMRFGEICSLKWEFVVGDVIELQGQDAKGDGGEDNARSIPMAGKEVVGILARRRAARQVKKGDTFELAALIFHHNGKPIVDIRKAWQTAALKAGAAKMVCRVCEQECKGKWHCKKPCRYVGRLFHDLRRSAVKNMDEAGISRDVAMSISGHRTQATYSRYNIADTKRKRKAFELAEEFRARKQAEEAAESNVVELSR